MKILVEIDLPEMDLNDFFGVKSNIFDNKGNVYINKNNLNFVDETFALLKYAGHLEVEESVEEIKQQIISGGIK